MLTKLLKPELPVQTQTAFIGPSTHELKLYFASPHLSDCVRGIIWDECLLSLIQLILLHERFSLLFCQSARFCLKRGAVVYVSRSLLPITIHLSYTFKHDSKEISNTAAEQINVSVRGAERVQLFHSVWFINSNRSVAPNDRVYVTLSQR